MIEALEEETAKLAEEYDIALDELHQLEDDVATAEESVAEKQAEVAELQAELGDVAVAGVCRLRAPTGWASSASRRSSARTCSVTS